jgi:hypothetical protein
VNPLLPEEGEPEMPAVPARPAFAPAAPMPPPLDRVAPLNLARRPFLNSRPVVRAALLLWLLGLAILAVNLSQVWGYRERSADKRERIARGEAEIERQQAAFARLQKTLDGINLEAQNQKVEFLNEQIAERTFSWSRFLDRITERLPNDVRLNRLTPQLGDKAQQQRVGARLSSARRSRAASDPVPLLITGETRSDEALYTFVDSLLKPPFSAANFTREEREEDGKTLKFEISVDYRPGPPPAAAASPEGPAPRIEELPMPGAAAGVGAPAGAPEGAPAAAAPKTPKTGVAPAAPAPRTARRQAPPPVGGRP